MDCSQQHCSRGVGRVKFLMPDRVSSLCQTECALDDLSYCVLKECSDLSRVNKSHSEHPLGSFQLRQALKGGFAPDWQFHCHVSSGGLGRNMATHPGDLMWHSKWALREDTWAPLRHVIKLLQNIEKLKNGRNIASTLQRAKTRQLSFSFWAVLSIGLCCGIWFECCADLASN
eukprot:1927769-Amphidinium_carterae.1